MVNTATIWGCNNLCRYRDQDYNSMAQWLAPGRLSSC